MTLVAAFASESHPLVIGDLLLSGLERENDVGLPTIDGAQRVFPRGSGYSIVGLAQKIAIVSDDCVVAWAGSRLGAAHVIRQLRARAPNGRVDYDFIKSAMSDLRAESPALRFVIVACIAHDKTRSEIFHIGGETLQTKALGKVMAAGTGTAGFRGILQNALGEAPISGDPNSLDRAIARAYTATGTLLQAEVNYGRTLLQYFGGGYEVATRICRRFQKIDDTTYVFWNALETDSGVDFTQPVCIIRQHHAGDFLVIRAATSEYRDDSNELYIRHQSLHGIPPVYRSTTDDDRANVVPLPFKSKRINHCFLVRLLNRETVVFVHHEWLPQGTSQAIHFEETTGAIAFAVNMQFLESITESVKRIASTSTAAT